MFVVYRGLLLVATSWFGSYKLPFRFNGSINKLTFNLGLEQLMA